MQTFVRWWMGKKQLSLKDHKLDKTIVSVHKSDTCKSSQTGIVYRDTDFLAPDIDQFGGR